MHVIIANAHGDVAVYEATVENAKTLLSDQTIPEEVVTFAQAIPERYTTYDTIVRIINKILKAADDEVVFRSKRDETQVIIATREAKQELVMYLFDRNITPVQLSERLVQTHCTIEELKCLAYFHGMPLVEEWVADWATKYEVITHDKWKDSATTVGKISYILRFINELAHRDVHYDIVEVKATC